MTSITILVDHLSVEKRTFLTGNENWLTTVIAISLPAEVEEIIESYLPPEMVETPIIEKESGYIECFDDLNNKYAFPVDTEEEHCFTSVYEDDFIIEI